MTKRRPKKILEFCTFRQSEVVFIQEERTVFEHLKVTTIQPGKPYCSVKNDCIEEEVTCKWSNGNGPDYLVDKYGEFGLN